MKNVEHRSRRVTGFGSFASLAAFKSAAIGSLGVDNGAALIVGGVGGKKQTMRPHNRQ